MRRFVTLFVATVAGLVVLLGFKTAPARAPRPVALSGATPGASSTAPDSSTPLSSAPASSAPASSAAGSPTATPTPAPTAKPTPKPSNTTKTLTGTAVTVGEGRRVFGVVQVRLTLTNGKITAADAIQVPQNDGHSLDLSNYSIPTLSQEVVSAQSASIDAVSGATYTSEAYAQSVQAALDAAKA